MGGDVFLRDADHFQAVVVPQCALRSEQHLHHGTESAELQPAGKQIVVCCGRGEVAASIGAPRGDYKVPTEGSTPGTKVPRSLPMPVQEISVPCRTVIGRPLWAETIPLNS